MKNLNSILRQMQRIAPDEQYAASSRAEILASRTAAFPRVTLAAFFRTAGIGAMATLAFVGGLSLVRLSFPAPTQQQASVSQQTLAAEAQAIDSQLALADVQNQAVSGNSGRSISAAAASIAKSAAGTSPDTSVDRALDALSE